MSTSAPATSIPTGRPMLPPEERFWERYSPHNEAPLSGVSSTVLHILILGLLLGIIWVNSYFKLDEEHRSLPLEPIKFDNGGSNRGDRDGTGVGRANDNQIGPERPIEGDRPDERRLLYLPPLSAK